MTNCDKQCELRSFESHQIVERTQRPGFFQESMHWCRKLLRGHVCCHTCGVRPPGGALLMAQPVGCQFECDELSCSLVSLKVHRTLFLYFLMQNTRFFVQLPAELKHISKQWKTK